MSLIAWIALGLIAGFIASKIVKKSGHSLSLDSLWGVIGAVAGGYFYQIKTGSAGVILSSLLAAGAGAVICLIIYHLFFGVADQRSD